MPLVTTGKVLRFRQLGLFAPRRVCSHHAKETVQDPVVFNFHW